MSEEPDEPQLHEDYVDGTLGKVEAERLIAQLDQSDPLKEKLALAALVDRLLLASRLPPLSSDKVMKALRDGGHFPARVPKRQHSVFGLTMALVILALLVGGSVVWWRSGGFKGTRTPAPVRAVSVTTSSREASRPRPVQAKIEVAEVQAPLVEATGNGGHVEAPESDLRTITAEVGELPESDFIDVSPLPMGDGSDEPGFVPPAKGKAVSPLSSGEIAKIGTPISEPMVPTRPRETPQSPVLFVNLQIGDAAHWSALPGVLDPVLGVLKTKAGLSYRVEVKAPDEVVADPEKNPVIYVSGHYHFSFTPPQRRLFRKFMLAGGTMVFDTGLGSKPFYDSARRELGVIFKEVPLERLSSAHPVYWAYYDLGKDRDHVSELEGVTVRCRAVAVVSRWGLVAGEKSDLSMQLGVNLASYIISWRSWVKPGRMPGVMIQEAAQGLFDRLRIGQAVYGKDWKPRPFALSMLLHTFSRRTSVPVQSAIREVRLTDPALFDLPILYMAGHEAFRLTDEEVLALRKYLESGGFLFAEACCGRRDFDQAFRSELRRVLPGLQLGPVSQASGLYSEPNTVKRISVTPLLAGQLGRLVVEPQLEGAVIRGHYAVVYSSYGMAGCWEMSQNPYALGYNDVEAVRLGQNILMYAVTH